MFFNSQVSLFTGATTQILFKSSSNKANKSPPGKYLSIIFSCSSANNNKSRNRFLFSIIFSIFTKSLLFPNLSNLIFHCIAPHYPKRLFIRLAYIFPFCTTHCVQLFLLIYEVSKLSRGLMIFSNPLFVM
jgi:hypothetical protein